MYPTPIRVPLIRAMLDQQEVAGVFDNPGFYGLPRCCVNPADMVGVMTLGHDLVDLAIANGALVAGICRAERFDPDHEALNANISSGRSGPLHFTYDDPDVSADVRVTHPWARSLIVMAVDYLARSSAPADTGAVIGRFATRDHYRMLDAPTTAVVRRLHADGHQAEILSDNTRLLDRAAAVRSGTGWRGLSTMVLTPGSGPWTLFGSVVTDANLEPSPPMSRTCGTCTACIPACPTNALDGDGLDARRCLSTWLQTGGTIPHWIRPHLGRRIYGCDDCLTACPPGFPAMNRSGSSPEEHPFDELLRLDDDSLLERFKWWYVPHRDPRILRRNVLIAAGNSGEPGMSVHITPYLEHRSALLRGHAAWALSTAGKGAAVPALVERLTVETEPFVREELLLALQMVEQPEAHREFIENDERMRGAGPYPAGMPTRKEPVTAAVRAIRNAGIAYESYLFDYERYPGAVGAAQAIGVELHETVKTIVFEASNGDGVIVLMNGDHEVSTKTLARHLGVKSTKPASADRARRWTGYEFGGTSPFGIRESLRLLANDEISRLERIYINAGSRGFLVAMDPAELIRALKPKIADLRT